jgi:hypothetical protein
MFNHKHKRFYETFITFTAIILLWRGIWGLFDMYLFPRDPQISYIFSIILGVILLYLYEEKIRKEL